MFHWNTIDNVIKVRRDQVLPIRRNGSFIEIYWEANGKLQRIGVKENDLKRLLKIKGHGASTNALVSYDEDYERITDE